MRLIKTTELEINVLGIGIEKVDEDTGIYGKIHYEVQLKLIKNNETVEDKIYCVEMEREMNTITLCEKDDDGTLSETWVSNLITDEFEEDRVHDSIYEAIDKYFKENTFPENLLTLYIEFSNMEKILGLFDSSDYTNDDKLVLLDNSYITIKVEEKDDKIVFSSDYIPDMVLRKNIESESEICMLACNYVYNVNKTILEAGKLNEVDNKRYNKYMINKSI